MTADAQRRRYIPYGRQSISEADVAAVIEVLRSDWLTQGPAIAAFEEALRQRVGARFAIAVCNATAALHLACIALDLRPGKRLWTSPNTFVASANCARYCGAAVDFVDIDPGTLNLSVAALARKLEDAQRVGALPDIVVPVHFGGLPCDMQAIGALAARYGFAVVEDAAHAVGAEYRSDPIGSCRHSDAAVFSFHPVKVMTTGEGGMIVTNSQPLADKLRRLRTHGITRAAAHMTGASEGDWYYQQIELGYNYRMTDLQAGLGLSQVRRLDAFLTRRRELAGRYDQDLQQLPLRIQSHDPDSRPAHHLYPVVVDTTRVARKVVFDRLRAAGIGVNVHYIPVHTQPYYQALGYRRGDFPHAEAYYAGALSLPLHYEMSDDDQDYVISQLRQALERPRAD